MGRTYQSQTKHKAMNTFFLIKLLVTIYYAVTIMILVTSFTVQPFFSYLLSIFFQGPEKKQQKY